MAVDLDRLAQRKKMNIEFTKEEANALAAMIDLAVKSGGLQVAGAAVLIMKKLEAAAKSAEKSE
jgi:hypothetical protein